MVFAGLIKNTADKQRKILISAICVALVMGHSVLSRSIRDSMLAGALHTDDLPRLTFYGTLVSLIITVTTSLCMRRWRSWKVIRASFLIAACSQLGLAFLPISPANLAELYFIHTSAANMLAISLVWLAINESIEGPKKERAVTIVLCAGTAGGLLAGLLLVQLPVILDLKASLLLLAAVNVTVLALLPAKKSMPLFAVEQKLSSDENRMWARLGVAVLAIAGILAASASTLLDLGFRVEAARHFSTQQSLLHFFGYTQALLGAAAFLAQAVLARGVSKGLESSWSMRLHPIFVGAACLLACIHPGFLLLAFLRTGEYAIRSSLFRAGTESTYLWMPSSLRKTARPIIDVAGERIGDAFAALLLQLCLWMRWQDLTRPVLLSISGLSGVLLVSCIGLKTIADRFQQTRTPQLKLNGKKAPNRNLRPFVETGRKTSMLAVLALLSVLTFASTPTQAEEETPDNSRAGMIERQRREKAQNLSPFSGSKLNQWLYYANSNHIAARILAGNHGIHPVLGTLGPGSGFGLGIGYTHLVAATGWSIDSRVSGSFHEYRDGVIAFAQTPRKNQTVRLESQASYRFSPRKDFYGEGPQSNGKLRTGYALEEGWIETNATILTKRSLLFRPSFRYWNLNVTHRTGDIDNALPTEMVFNEKTLPGVQRQTSFAKSTVLLGTGSKLNTTTPPGELSAFGSASLFHDLRGHGFSMYQWEVGGQKIFPFLQNSHAVRLRGHVAGSDSIDKNTVPFYLDYELGNQSTLRGFTGRRFYGRNEYDAAAEYMFRIANSVNFVIFSDAGNAFSQWKEWSRGGIKQSYGFGVRSSMANGKLLWSAEAGFSKEGSQFWITFASF